VLVQEGLEGSFVELQNGVFETEFTATGLTSGETYLFKVQARNAYGLGTASSSIQLLCAFIPAVPIAPTTSVSADQVILNWLAPNDNGSVITSYRILIVQQDGVYSEDTVNCDGSDSATIAAL
jgi:hypothetical protein